MIFASVILPDSESSIGQRIVEIRSVCQEVIGVIGKATKICRNVKAIVVKLSGLVVTVARVVQRAAIKCHDERNEAFMAVDQVIDGAAMRVNTYLAIDSANP